MDDSKPTLYFAIPLGLGALPLPIYPFLLLANIMSIAADRGGAEISAQLLVARIFLYGSTAYPLVYFFCVALAFISKRPRRAFGWSLVPLGYLLVVGIFFFIWMSYDA